MRIRLSGGARAPCSLLFTGSPEADVHRAALQRLLDDAIELLEEHHEQHWAAWLRVGQHQLSGDDPYGPDHLLRAFGGMGSFNDLLIPRQNGHRIRDRA